MRKRPPGLAAVLKWLALSCGAIGLACLALRAAAPDRTPTPVPTPDPTLSAAQSEPQVLAHLNAAISWYRESRVADGWVAQPSDAYYRDNLRELAQKAVAGSFSYASAMVLIMDSDRQAAAKGDVGDERQSRLTTRLAANQARLVSLNEQQASLNGRLAATPPPSDQATLEARGRVLQAEIDLAQALDDTLKKALSLSAGATSPDGAAGLESRIEGLRHSVPEAFGAGQTTPTKQPPPAVPESGGLLSRIGTLFNLVRSQRAMDALILKTAALQTAANQLADPIAAELRQQIQTGEEDGQDPGQLSDPVALEAARQRIEQVAARYRDLAAALLPVREESIALEQSHTNLENWKTSVVSQTDAIVRYLLVHTIALAAGLLLLLAVSEVWRRATFKYVHEPRRRRQFLLIRRFFISILIVTVVFTGFVSDFSSLATFAGFITAGIAVALQTIILSVAAYFFLIGRFGVKVGDRVTVAGVTGDVIDIGLVRVFLMELAGTGVDLHPTGRVVILANSALFSTVPVFKQLPGTNYAWHELYVAMADGAETKDGEALLLKAVNTVYEGYRTSIERQHGTLEQLVDYETDLPVPSAHVRVTDTALEIVVRFPAEIRRMAEIDELVTKEVIASLRGAEAVRKTFLSLPRIRAAVKS